MNMLGKDLKEYIDAIKIPVVLNVVVSLISIGVTLASGLLSLAGPAGGCLGCFTGLGFLGITLVVGIGSALYAGYLMAKKKGGSIVQTLVAGAILGLIVGLFGGLVSIINTIINIIFLGNVGANLVVGLLNLVIGPVIAMIIGAIFSSIGGLVGGAK